MDSLREELAKKRKAAEELAGSSSTKKKKYLTRQEIEEERARIMNEKDDAIAKAKEDQRREEQAALAAAAEQEATAKLEADRESLESKMPPRDEVIRKLRSLRQPVTFFGETDTERYVRLRELETHASEFMPGSMNDFAKTMRDHQLILATETIEGTDLEAAAAKKAKVEAELFLEPEGVDSKGLVLYFLKRLLRLWDAELELRPVDVKRTIEGQTATATFKQTEDYIKPMFKALKDGTIAEDILTFLLQIVDCLKQREYVRANDLYLRLSIGNAPWPIGVTMVGIHERSGREKLFASQVAHVLNDETQRKYIQSLKRLMTYCCKSFPNEDSAKNF